MGGCAKGKSEMEEEISSYGNSILLLVSSSVCASRRRGFLPERGSLPEARVCLSLGGAALLNAWGVSPSAVAPPPECVTSSERAAWAPASVSAHRPQAPGQVQNRARGTMGLCARVAFPPLPARTPRPRGPHSGPARPSRPSPPAPRAPPAPTPGGPRRAAAGHTIAAPPRRPPRSPSPNKSRFLSPPQIKDREGVRRSCSRPGGGGARDAGARGPLMASVWETRRNAAAGPGAAGRVAGTPSPPRPRRRPASLRAAGFLKLQFLYPRPISLLLVFLSASPLWLLFFSFLFCLRLFISI